MESGEPPSLRLGEHFARGKEEDIRKSKESSFSNFCERAFSREIPERLVLTESPPPLPGKDFLVLFTLYNLI